MSTLLINGQQATGDAKRWFSFHGQSVFTTLRSYHQSLPLWWLHWQRLCTHAAFFGYHLPDEQAVRALIKPHLHAGDQKIRIIVTASSYAITIEPLELPPPSIYQGVEVIGSRWQVHPNLAHYKTGNSLPYFMAHKEAVAAGAFEALLTNHDGYVVDGSRTSLIHYDGHTVYEVLGGLDGCMRRFILDSLKQRGFNVAQQYLRNDEMFGQLLLANSLMGLIPVLPIKFDEIPAIVDWFRMDFRNNAIVNADSP